MPKPTFGVSDETHTCIAESPTTSALVRTARRGKPSNELDEGESPVCPGTRWATAYRTENPRDSFVRWMAPNKNMGALNAKGTSAAPRELLTGISAAHAYPGATWAQSFDPTSSPQPVIRAYPDESGANNTPSKQTSIFRITGVTPRESTWRSEMAAKEWPLRIFSGPLMSGTTTIASSINDQFGTRTHPPTTWTIFNKDAEPPCPCTSGQPCDTSGVFPLPNNLALNPDRDAADVSYAPAGTNSDSKVPYVVINDPERRPWGGLIGRVVRSDDVNVGIPAVSVEVVSLAQPRQFTTVEKITKLGASPTDPETGKFEILIDGNLGAYQLRVNALSPSASSVVPEEQHFFNPAYKPYQTNTPPAVADWNMNGPLPAIHNLGNIALTPAPTSGGIAGTSSIQGEVMAAESLSIKLPNIVVTLWDLGGTQKGFTKTLPDGTYTLPNVSAGTYYLRIATDRTWIPTPAQTKITIAAGATLNGQNFAVRNVPATVTLKGAPGTLVVFARGSGGSIPDSPFIDFRGGAAMKTLMAFTIGRDGHTVVSIPHGLYNAASWKRNDAGAYVRNNFEATFNAAGTHTVNVP